jgi:hypothetical protein
VAYLRLQRDNSAARRKAGSGMSARTMEVIRNRRESTKAPRARKQRAAAVEFRSGPRWSRQGTDAEEGFRAGEQRIPSSRVLIRRFGGTRRA